MAIHWKADEQYFTVMLLIFQFSPACNSGKFINFRLGTVRSQRIKVETGRGDNLRLFKITLPGDRESKISKHLFTPEWVTLPWSRIHTRNEVPGLATHQTFP